TTPTHRRSRPGTYRSISPHSAQPRLPLVCAPALSSTARVVGDSPHPGWGLHAHARVYLKEHLNVREHLTEDAAVRARRAAGLRARSPPGPSLRLYRGCTSPTWFPSLQSPLMSAAPGLFRPP